MLLSCSLCSEETQ
ncbi:hypothetical protein KIPB_016386, partial [Kipferlia bialata]|eukprot:g16386.t1